MYERMNMFVLFLQEANLQRVNLEVKTGSDLEEVELRVVELLDQVIEDCRYTLTSNSKSMLHFLCKS